MRKRKSSLVAVMENCIFLARPRRKKRKPEVSPSDIKTFAYTSHLHDVMWERLHARRKHDS
ncbi:NinE family protein [Cronobacter sakazakii]|nr:NinE family protein [Cronobacter sakazakii]